MKKYLRKFTAGVSFCLLSFLIPAQSFAQHNFGAGIVVGDPTGLTAKYVLSPKSAIDAALSFGRHKFYIHSSYLALWPTGTNIDNFPLTWYFGVGPRVIQHDHHKGRKGHDHDDETHFGARVPIGLRMNFNEPRIELFGEISVTMDVVPETELDFDFGIGARYYF